MAADCQQHTIHAIYQAVHVCGQSLVKKPDTHTSISIWGSGIKETCKASHIREFCTVRNLSMYKRITVDVRKSVLEIIFVRRMNYSQFLLGSNTRVTVGFWKT